MDFKSYGQIETLISSIRNIIKDYPHESVFKEFLQNADDAGATRFHVIIDHRSHPTRSLFCDKLKDWQGPAILLFNNAKFNDSDFNSLMQIRVGGKQDDDTKIGKHGLGFNSCYHFTDVPSFISGDHIAFLDPQEKFLSEHGKGVKGAIPKNGIRGKDHLVPFEGIEGINFRSTFEGTLFRIPLREKPSKISDTAKSADDIRDLIDDIKTNFSSQFLFLRNIETIKMSYIPEDATKPRLISIWEANIIGLDQNIRNKRKYVTNGVTQIFRLNIEIIDYENGIQDDKQIDHWIIITGSQQNPEDSELKKYAKRHRLRVLGGIAALLKSLKHSNYAFGYEYQVNHECPHQSNFMGIMYSFLSLPDVTHLPVHLNGNWAQGSDRGRLLIESDDLPDLDHQKLKWNRHILLEFLPKLHCELLKEIVDLRIDGLEDHPISKFWPFPPATRNSPKYAIEYGLEVLQHILRSEDNFWSPNETDPVDSLFKLLSRTQAYKLYCLLRSHWDELEIKFNPELKSLVRSFPIWPTLPDVLQPESESEPPLKPVSCGFILPKNFKRYRTKESKFYFVVQENIDRQIFSDLDVSTQDIYKYTFEDVEFPSEYDCDYLNFLSGVLKYPNVAVGLKDKCCFPTLTKRLKKITDLYDYNNIVFRTVFNENLDTFLHPELLEHKEILSKIGFKNEINQETLIKCAIRIEKLQRERNSSTDVRLRSSILVDYLYKHINDFTLEGFECIVRIKFVPISRDLVNPYSMNVNGLNRGHRRVLDCFDNIILPKYKGVAWSQMPLISEDVIPPPNVLKKYPSLGKPKVSDVIEHLRYLYETLQDGDEWKAATLFRHDVYDVYKWLEEECKNDDDLNLREYIYSSEPLFLNFNIDQDPFNDKNWVSVENLVLNSEPNNDKYVNPSLAEYSTMLKSAGTKEVKRPNVKINVRDRKQSYINKSTVFEFLLDEKFPLNDFTFIVNGESIGTSRYMLAASSEFFRRKLISDPNLTKIIVDDVRPNSVRVLLRYLYDQSIDDAIQSLRDLRSDGSLKLQLYKDLLKLANSYQLDHLKELMESKLSWLVTMSNAKDMQRFAEDLNAGQLERFCDQFILDNNELNLERSARLYTLSNFMEI